MAIFPGRIAVMGGGSWATALAKILLSDNKKIMWYMRRQDRIDDFIKLKHNPVYLSDVAFDISRIEFSCDINYVCEQADTILLAMPSPYIKEHLKKINIDLSDKYIVSAVKGIVPDENLIVTEYMQQMYNVKPENMLVVSGPCHAEEVALERLSYLTVGCENKKFAKIFSEHISGKDLKTILSTDLTGIEYSAVLKNVYAIASGIIHGMKGGDNFLAMLLSNAILEIERFVNTVAPHQARNICDSVYLGDLLVTSYSRFSRNHNFGAMIGRGYSVKAAMMEMEMVAEGYYATKCIHEINEKYNVRMPILDEMFNILYCGKKFTAGINSMADSFC
ncbi:MAG: NAD(P)-binding domain-containing protein [Muribaculaceae bacterium]|nr:NAD(P)-binding domain-containing protein [Muribaculaceae bacterium]